MDDQNETAKRRPKWGVILSLGVLVLVTAAVLAFVISVGSEPEPGPVIETYGAWQFEQRSPFWVTFYQREGLLYEIRFPYLPQEVENISVRGSQVRLAEPLYLSFDPSMSNESKQYLNVAFSDATTKLIRMYDIRPLAACTQNVTDPACANVSTITCDSNVSAIVFTESSEPSVTLDGTCIRVEASGEDLYRAETLVWYRLLDIIR